MNVFALSWYNLRAKPLATLLSLLLLMLGVSMISLMLLLNKQLQENFDKNVQGIDMVLGAKGSPLQIILASVYHIDAPTGNIPLYEANSISKNPLVEQAIPLSFGDNYKGYRILGTDEGYIEHYGLTLAEGRQWKKSMEICLGAGVAQKLGLKLGDEFFGSHGLGAEGHAHEEAAYTVVGIFKPTQNVADQLLMTSLESVWDIHDHEGHDHEEDDHEEDDHEGHDHDDHEGHDHDDHEGHDHDDHEGHDHEAQVDSSKSITAMLLSFRSPMGVVALPRMINEQTSMQAALPAIEINRLFGLLGVGIETLRALALAIIVISGISVFISLYTSLRARRYELALMRSLGASRMWLFVLIIQEGIILAVLGGVLGLIMSRVGIFFLGQLTESSYYFSLSAFSFVQEELWLLVLTLVIGIIAALLPAWQAYRTDISQTLADA